MECWGSKIVFSQIQPDLVCELHVLTLMAHATAHFFGPRLLGPWGGAKRSNIIKSQLQSQFQRFLKYKTLCVFSQMKDIKHISRDFYLVPWIMHAPGFGTWGCWGVKNLIFLNMVMWHIKLKGMISRPGYTENFYPGIKQVTLRLGQRIKYH